MPQELIVAVITGSATVLTVGLTYIFTKKKEIEAALDKKKTDMYDELVKTLTEANIHQWDMKLMNKFIEAFYKASAYASDEVIQACHKFIASFKESDDVTNTKLMSDIYNAVRKDIYKKARTFDFAAFSAVPSE